MDHRTILNPPRPAPAAPGAATLPIAVRAPASAAPATTRPPAPPPHGAILVDHAVFTSIRTPTGEGYRIVAATAGVKTEEKTEITRRSPSHGGLGATGPAARGLSCYPLPTGRYAVAWSCHAGKEHTARGGDRVYTHVAILPAEDYARFGCDPFRVHDLIARAVGDALVLKPPPRLDPLPLPAPRVAADPSAAALPLPDVEARDMDIDPILLAANALLTHSNLVLLGADRPWTLFAGLIAATPRFARAGLSASVGLLFSPSRQFALCLVDADHGETRRSVLGQPITLIEAGKLPALTAGPYSDWLAHVRGRLAAGRSGDLAALTQRMVEPLNGPALAHVAELCDAADRVAAAPLPALLELAGRLSARRAESNLEQTLASELLHRVQQRVENLREAEARAAGPSSPSPSGKGPG